MLCCGRPKVTTYVKIQFLANSAVARVFVAAVLFVCLVRACGTDQGSEQARVFVAAVLFVCLVRACGTDQGSEQAVDLQRSFFLGVGVKVNCCPVLSTSL